MKGIAMSQPIENLASFDHPDHLARTICQMALADVLERLAAGEAALRDQIMHAAGHLRDCDAGVADALAGRRADLQSRPSIADHQQQAMDRAQEALAAGGYLHPTEIRSLDSITVQALADRHEARGTLADHLDTAAQATASN
jgi:hypothetical protein